MEEVDMDSREYFLNCIIVHAIEGGTGYWAVVHEYKPRDAGDGWAVIQQFDEGTGDPFGNKFRLDCPTIEKTITDIVAGKFDIHYDDKHTVARASEENDAGDIDADLADIIVQLATLGEVVYG